MNPTDLLTLLAFAFQFLLGLTSASPVSMFSAVTRSLNLNTWVPAAPIARRDDDHLCSASTDLVYEYGNQTDMKDLLLDCEALSEKFKNVTDEQGNITQSCGNPPPPSSVQPGASTCWAPKATARSGSTVWETTLKMK